MRILDTIPHAVFRISIHGYNNNYILEIQAGPFKQAFTFPEDRIGGAEQIKAMVTEEFLLGVEERFRGMKQDVVRALNL